MARKFGRYELIRELGSGGQAVVYEARDPRAPDHSVALKVLLPSSGSINSIKRFEREARTIARLEHPNIVTIHEVGESDGRPYIAMELVDWVSLEEVVRTGPMPWRAAVTIVRAVAKAAHHAHEHGVIHRDMKPANIVMDSKGEPKLMDFGFALDMDAETRLTQSGAVVGTLAYMPPEQARGRSREADARSDVYSLGAIFYEVLTGRPPFKAETWLMLLSMICHDTPEDPSEIRHGVPGDAAMICMKCLEKEPERRYQTAGELADDCGRLLAGDAVGARPASLLHRVGEGLARHKRGAALTAVVAMILLAASLVWYEAHWPTFFLAGRPGIPPVVTGPDEEVCEFLARPAASLYIDGKLVAEETPPLYRTALPVGEHKVRFVVPGGATSERTIRVVKGRPARWCMNFVKGTLRRSDGIPAAGRR